MESSSGIEVRSLHGIDELQAASRLYREVFQYADADLGVNPRLLRSLQSNGGSVVGAVDNDGELIAFAYGFRGASGGQTYHYSQAAVIAPAHQGRGLGRALKLAQRDVALAGGTATMRWTYDPVLVRNAHFNFDVLGARGRWFERDFYDEPDSDRVTVEWNLDPGLSPADSTAQAPTAQATAQAPTAPAAPAPTAPAAEDPARWCVPLENAAGTWLHLPADFASVQRRSPELAAQVRSRLALAMEELFGQGLAAVSCVRLSEEDAAYRLVPVLAP